MDDDADTGPRDELQIELVQTIRAAASGLFSSHDRLNAPDPKILEVSLKLACAYGLFGEAKILLMLLQKSSGKAYVDAAETIELGQRMDSLPSFETGSIATLLSEHDCKGPYHHSTISHALIGAAEKRKRVDKEFAHILVESLRGKSVLTSAAIETAFQLLLKLGRDVCALPFFDLVDSRLSKTKRVTILNGAIASATKRGATNATGQYVQRFAQEAGCQMAGIARLASYVGVQSSLQAAHRQWLNAVPSSFGPNKNAAPAYTQPLFPASATSVGADDRIDVFLKCVKRPFDIEPFVSFWLECFNDPMRYRIRLLDDSGLNLADRFASYPIIDSCSLRNDDRNEALRFFNSSRHPLSALGWESVANLTPFAQTHSRWFWNIDADDIRPVLTLEDTMESVQQKLRAVELFAAHNNLTAISYDIWASAHYLFDHGYHWTFGICFCQSNPTLMGEMLASMSGCDEPPFKINLDHLFSRLSDGDLADGRFQDCFASFIFDRPSVLHKDINGNEVTHSHEYFKKRLLFGSTNAFVQDDLHAKTLVL